MTCSPPERPVIDHDVRRRIAARLYPPRHGFPILDDEQVDALLVGEQRRLRHHDLFLRRADLQQRRRQAGRR